MPMLRSLYTLEDQTEDEKLKPAIVAVRNDVEAGSSLQQAMERQPSVFDRSTARWCARARARAPRAGARAVASSSKSSTP